MCFLMLVSFQVYSNSEKKLNIGFYHGSFPDNGFWQETSDVVSGICNSSYRLPDPSYPINKGIHTVWSFCATIRAMDAAQETVKCTPESYREIWLDSRILEVCAGTQVSEWSRIRQKIVFHCSDRLQTGLSWADDITLIHLKWWAIIMLNRQNLLKSWFSFYYFFEN